MLQNQSEAAYPHMWLNSAVITTPPRALLGNTRLAVGQQLYLLHPFYTCKITPRPFLYTHILVSSLDTASTRKSGVDLAPPPPFPIKTLMPNTTEPKCANLQRKKNNATGPLCTLVNVSNPTPRGGGAFDGTHLVYSRWQCAWSRTQSSPC